MPKVTAALIGAGQRGARAYGPYGLEFPEELQFVAVAELGEDRRMKFQEAHSIASENSFEQWEALLGGPRLADAVVICTQDQLHFEPAKRALEMGYHVLLEKPMAASPEECVQLGEIAAKHDRVFTIGHVLRYTEFYKQLKQLLVDGAIGRLIAIQHTENVEHRHQAHSFVRGNWRNSESSSPMILSKSCHDMDVLLWLVDSDCTKVSSFGSLTHFRAEHAPVGAPLRCTDGCPVEASCPYYAPKMYLEREDWAGLAIRKVVSEDISREAVMHQLRVGPYGRCVYHCDNNVVDHQVVNLEFANEVTVAFTMCAFTMEGGRSMNLMGTGGQIRAHMEKNVIELSDFSTGETKTIAIHAPAEGHGGGDFGLMRDFIKLVSEGGKEASLTGAQVSVQSHLMAFAAEKSRLESRIIDMEQYRRELLG
ncbi:Gfo/Idh/MocA family protein [Paenibacillus albus]|uniref:Gfo/Idh/MocA family oxidoreductase n=1 Tax=Paenibacillus albus TaxID=2495582 RepID=A0A3Q8X8E3_9BACL|nr:Gfo/Idh/MocA family oxidoreductase [Paenibacillus albus]AZN41221.1 Gfo/Idh/MocA family oxidoreductase [Paenibacillus albus]